jgi:hypothetical protein
MVIVFACDMNFVIWIYTIFLYCILLHKKNIFTESIFFHINYLNNIIYIYDSKIHTKVRYISNMHTIKFKVDYRYVLWDTKFKYNTMSRKQCTKNLKSLFYYFFWNLSTILGYNHSSGNNLLAANKKPILRKEKDEFILHVLYCGAVSYDRQLLAY